MENIEDLEDRLFEEAEIELDEFHAHESLDRMFLIVDIFNAYVREHPYINQNKELAEKAEELSDQLHDFYNTVSMHIWNNEDQG